ncbi:hypothetical protein F4804DRAFT_333334 [Jackrogersella minutella]|nr:hypothetical protein F4804DRAFT_333334 [Jackrogersella minutella]
MPQTLLEEAVAYDHDLSDFLEYGNTVDKEQIMSGLESAVRHLHSIGLAHNDVKPRNIMVDEKIGEPILIDFGSCHKIGDKMTSSRGTDGWLEEDDYLISKESRDITALDKMCAWLDKPTFE